MLRELIEKEASVVKSAVLTVREWLHLAKPTEPHAPEVPPTGGEERRETPPESKPTP